MNMTDYEAARKTFRLQVPGDYEFTRDVVERWAAQHPGKLALVAVGAHGGHRREISFGELATASRRVANALEALGATAGERAFVMLPRIPEWYELLLGMFRFGVIPMPATTLCTARDIAQRIERAGATIAVVDDEAAVKLAEVRDQCPSLRHVIVVGEPVEGGCERYGELIARAGDVLPTGRVTKAGDPLLLYFTSGTVAAPKMVLHTHASMGAGHEITARFWQDLTPADLHWTFSDTGWAKAAWGKLFGQWQIGCTVVAHDAAGKFDAKTHLELIGK
ncbi:MAG: acetyl-CoA synthetase, partial [Gaiellales bacterium]|nr:acetyl-CoA synthetase [Gaiellales bacterium]